jgi:hypothetical protein
VIPEEFVVMISEFVPEPSHYISAVSTLAGIIGEKGKLVRVATGRDLKSTASTIEKIAVLPPIPRARVRRQTAVNPGAFASMRTA